MYDKSRSTSSKQITGPGLTTTLPLFNVGPTNRPLLGNIGATLSEGKSSHHAAVQMMGDRTVVGGRPKGWAIDGSMGNHVSAYKLHKGVVEAALDANDIDGSIKRMETLATHLKTHPAYDTLKKAGADVGLADQRLDNLDKTVAKLKGGGITGDQKISLLQEAGKHYLAAHEILPGAVAFNAPGGGNAEGQALSVTEMKRIFGAKSQYTYKDAIKNSFDFMVDDRVYTDIKGKGEEDVNNMMPGMGGMAGKGTLLDNLAGGHVHSIEAAAIALNVKPQQLIDELYGSKAKAVQHFKKYMDPDKVHTKALGVTLPKELADDTSDSANFAVNLTLSENGKKIVDMNSKPRPGTNLDAHEGMGSHLTSWGTYEALLKNAVKDKTLKNAATGMVDVAQHVNTNRMISAKMEGLDGDIGLVNGVEPKAKLMDIQAKARALMIAMNKTKGAAVPNAVNNSRNESGYLKTLSVANGTRYGPKPTKGELSTAFHGLMDLSALEVDPADNGTDGYEEALINSSKNKILTYTRHTQTMLGVSDAAVDAAEQTHKKGKTASGVKYSEIFKAMREPTTAINILDNFNTLDEMHAFANYISDKQPETKPNKDKEGYVPKTKFNLEGQEKRITRSEAKKDKLRMKDEFQIDKYIKEDTEDLEETKLGDINATAGMNEGATRKTGINISFADKKESIIPDSIKRSKYNNGTNKKTEAGSKTGVDEEI